MNCLEYRRRLLTDPADRAPEVLQHQAQCPPCAQESDCIRHVDQQLRTALNVEVPDDLASRILLRRSLQPRRPALPLRRLAWVASLVLCAGLAGWTGYAWRGSAGYPTLEAAVLEHVAGEAVTMEVDGDIPHAQVRALLARFGADLRGDLGRVRYAGICHVRNRDGAHLVLAGRQGPVMVLILPHESVSGRQVVRSPQFFGVIVPARQGSIAVLGEADEALQETADQVADSLVWL